MPSSTARRSRSRSVPPRAAGTGGTITVRSPATGDREQRRADEARSVIPP